MINRSGFQENYRKKEIFIFLAENVTLRSNEQIFPKQFSDNCRMAENVKTAALEKDFLSWFLIHKNKNGKRGEK